MDKGEKVIDKNNKLINVKLVIEYDGKKYFGWQKQKNKPTIQQTIEEALQVLIPGNKIKLTGAGRTDTGVHALNQTANFRINKNEFNSIGKRKFLNSLNAILSADIAVKDIIRVGDKFNSRFSARKRTYVRRATS